MCVACPLCPAGYVKLCVSIKKQEICIRGLKVSCQVFLLQQVMERYDTQNFENIKGEGESFATLFIFICSPKCLSSECVYVLVTFRIKFKCQASPGKVSDQKPFQFGGNLFLPCERTPFAVSLRPPRAFGFLQRKQNVSQMCECGRTAKCKAAFHISQFPKAASKIVRRVRVRRCLLWQHLKTKIQIRIGRQNPQNQGTTRISLPRNVSKINYN